MKNKHKGFTLIEMMLVITLIAIIAALSILTLRRHAESELIDKAALEIEQVLEAGIAYNNINGKWPKNNNALPTCDPNSNPDLTDFIHHYLPNGETINDFGHHYCWGSMGGTNQNNTLFWVAIQVPNNDLIMAKRIAARLPNAITTSNPNSTTIPTPLCMIGAGPCYVRAEIPESGAGSNNEGAMTVAIGSCKTGQTITDLGICEDISAPGQQNYKITFNSCPQGLVPDVMISPDYITVPMTDVPDPPIKSLTSTVNRCTDTPDANNQESCVITIEADVCTGSKCQVKENIKSLPGSAVGANYLTACVKKINSFKRNNWL